MPETPLASVFLPRVEPGSVWCGGECALRQVHLGELA